MSVIPIHARGVNRAKLHCDDCPASAEATCAYERQPGGGWAANEGQIRLKLSQHGWMHIKGKDLCPDCAARRRATQTATTGGETMTKAKMQPSVAPEQTGPTAKQIRAIMLALEDAYDDQALRYRGAHTDASVAQDIGGGVMPGWVASRREELFGPAGNEEVERIRDELRRLKADHDAMIEGLRRDLDKQLAALTRRVDACVMAHDKRVGK